MEEHNTTYKSMTVIEKAIVPGSAAYYKQRLDQKNAELDAILEKYMPKDPEYQKAS